MTHKISYTSVVKGKIIRLVEEDIMGILSGSVFIDLTEELEKLVKEKITINSIKTFDDEGNPILFVLSKKDMDNITFKREVKSHGRKKD